MTRGGDGAGLGRAVARIARRDAAVECGVAEQRPTKGDRVDVDRNEVPLQSCRWRYVESRLVAEPAAAGRPAPAFLAVESAGHGLQLRRGVQEPRLRGSEEGSTGADDRLAGLVAG